MNWLTANWLTVFGFVWVALVLAFFMAFAWAVWRRFRPATPAKLRGMANGLQSGRLLKFRPPDEWTGEW